MSPLTLCPLHGCQTASVHEWPPLLIPLMIFMSHMGRGRVVRTVDMPNLPDNSSSNWRREKLSSVTYGAPAICLWWGRLSTIHQGHFWPSTNLKKPGGTAPFQPSHLKGGTSTGCLLAAAPRKKIGHFFKVQNHEKMRLKAISLPAKVK